MCSSPLTYDRALYGKDFDADDTPEMTPGRREGSIAPGLRSLMANHLPRPL